MVVLKNGQSLCSAQLDIRSRGHPSTFVGPMDVHTDDVLDVKKLHAEMIEADYVFQYSYTIHNPIHGDVIRRDLNRQLGSLTPAIMTELEDTFKGSWGVDTEQWKEIRVFETITRIITRVTNHVLVGQPLCKCDML